MAWFDNKNVECEYQEKRYWKEIDAQKLIDTLSKLDPIFKNAYSYWNDHHTISIFDLSRLKRFDSALLYRFDFSKIAVQDIISAFASGDINSFDCDGIDKFV